MGSVEVANAGMTAKLPNVRARIPNNMARRTLCISDNEKERENMALLPNLFQIRSGGNYEKLGRALTLSALFTKVANTQISIRVVATSGRTSDKHQEVGLARHSPPWA